MDSRVQGCGDGAAFCMSFLWETNQWGSEALKQPGPSREGHQPCHTSSSSAEHTHPSSPSPGQCCRRQRRELSREHGILALLHQAPTCCSAGQCAFTRRMSAQGVGIAGSSLGARAAPTCFHSGGSLAPPWVESGAPRMSTPHMTWPGTPALRLKNDHRPKEGAMDR